jgi:hypothetical protein
MAARDDYPSAIARLVCDAPLAPLGPGRPREELRPVLAALDASSLFGDRPPRDEAMVRCCLAGLWLAYDFLDESHRISQEIETREGSYWHGIMHRREPDYSNSKYWFRRVGRHEVFEPLREEAAKLAGEHREKTAAFMAAQNQWDPNRFVDLCETAARADRTGESPLAMLCRQVAQAEWRLLFDHCYRRAVG